MERATETTDDVQCNVGLRIAELREARGWRPTEFAERLNVSVRYVQRVEAGRANLTLDSLVKLARMLGVRAADLLATAAKRSRPVGRPVGREERRPRRIARR